eukprot:1716181-Rhodomonas_salina.1
MMLCVWSVEGRLRRCRGKVLTRNAVAVLIRVTAGDRVTPPRLVAPCAVSVLVPDTWQGGIKENTARYWYDWWGEGGGKHLISEKRGSRPHRT